MVRRVLLAGVLLALAGCASGPSGTDGTGTGMPMPMALPSGEPTANHIAIDDAHFEYDATGVRASMSEPVVFQNTGKLVHNVSIHAPDGRQVADHDVLPGESWSLRFAGTGDYHAFCKHHTSNHAMQVMVDVEM